jgi:hypothetical protein
MAGEVKREDKYMMRFVNLNAGPDGVHYPGAEHEIGAARAAALADDGHAVYLSEDKAAEHKGDVERAAEVNAKRAAAGRHPLPVRMALAPGAEAAAYTPLQKGSSWVGMDWRDAQRVADILRAQQEGGHGGPAAEAESTMTAAESVAPHEGHGRRGK